MTVAKQIFNSLTEYIQVKYEKKKKNSRAAGFLLCNKTQFLSVGPLHRKPAVSGPQQAVGCHCWLPSRLRSHDDEAGAGTKIITFITPLE